MVQVADAILEPKSTLERAKNVNYANRSCRNGWSCLSDRTLHQRGDDPQCCAIVPSGKLSEVDCSLHSDCRDLLQTLLMISNTDPGQARTYPTRSSDQRRRLQRCRQPQVRPPRHRHRHLHSHRSKPNTLDQSSRVCPSPTLCTSRVRRTTTASSSQRSS